MGFSESTFSKYAFGRGGGGHKKSTLCMLVIMMTIMDDPLVRLVIKADLLSFLNSKTEDLCMA